MTGYDVRGVTPPPTPVSRPAPGLLPGRGTMVPKQESFRAILDEKLAGLKFSRHASERLENRRISLTPEQLARLERGVDRAAGKGARESLILLDDLALVVSIKNRTVITAASRQELRENVFTNIDSAVLL